MKTLIRRAAACIPPSWRTGSTYAQVQRFLDAAQRWPRERVDAWQMNQLRSVVRLAYDGTDGYRKLFKDAGATPDDIRSLDDFRRLPFTTKAMLQDNLEAFSLKGPGRRYVTTGGSTGIPFGFYQTRAAQHRERAFMHHGWARAGWKLGMSSAVLRGWYVGSEHRVSSYDPFWRELHLSSYFLTAKSLPVYAEAIRSHNVRVLQAYPSSLNLMCDLLQETGTAGQLGFDIILLGSENVYDWQLAKFEKNFPKARLFAWYGHAEQVILAPWCETSRSYHAWPFYGWTELVDTDGREVAEGVEGELVGTGFQREGTLFIRYKTMDRAEKGGDACHACGRPFMLISRIAGRAHEVIVTSTGRHISMTAINMHDEVFDGIRQFQFVQSEQGRVEFRYVPRRVLPAEELAAIRTRLMTKLGTDMNLTMTHVAEIARTRSGKFRFLDQRLDLAYGDH